MPTITLTLPTAGTVIAAGLHSNNYAALQALLNAGLDTANLAAAAGIKGAQLASGITGPPGTRLTHDDYTSDVNITATTEATAQAIVTATAFSFDGATPVMIEYFAPRVDKGTTLTNLWLYDGASSIGRLGQVLVSTGPVRAARRLTPSNASHTFSVRGSVDAGTGVAYGAAGGAGLNMPGYIRITKE